MKAIVQDSRCSTDGLELRNIDTHAMADDSDSLILEGT